MKIEQTDRGWIIRVPDLVVEALRLDDGAGVTIRPVVRREDEVCHHIAQLRGNLPDYPFESEDWDGVGATATNAITH